RYYSENEKYLLVSYAQILVNIRQRMQAEENLQNERLLLRTVIDNIPDTIYAKDLNFNKTLANNAEVKLLGAISEDDVIGQTDAAYYAPDFAQRFMEDDQIVIQTGVADYNREGFIFDANGQKHWMLSSKLPLRNKDNQIVGIIGIGHDITNRKSAEEALRISEEKYRNIFDNVQDVFYQIDIEGKILEISPSIKYFSEFDRDKLLGNSVNEIYTNAEDRKLLLAELIKHGEIRDYELNIKTPLEVIKQVSINARLNYDENGNPDHIDGAIRDISKRKQAEIALRESDKKFHDYVDFAPHGIFVANNRGTYVDVNAAGSIITGYSKDELLNIKQTKLLAEESYQKFYNHTKKVLNDGFATDEYIIVRKDGSKGFCKVDTVKLSNDRFLGFVVDITKRRKIEEALNNSQSELKKFAAHLQNVREEERIMLAREIHDELGQILIAIKIDTGLLKQKVLKVVDTINYMEIMSKFDNLFGLVDNTINTARKIMTDLRPEVLYLLGFEEAVKLHISKFQERHNIDCQFYTEDFKLELTEQQSVALYRIVQEALTNIVKHAKATKVDIHINLINNVLTLEISDNGIGFDQNHKVKSDSYGMLGMKERVYLLAGELSIVGRPDKGTTVRVVMPY
ncbi:MAG: PAS domain S-box protein, partial [Paludibacter sp.]